ncbi:helix-turn-helix transcriptional regulator [Marinobacter sp.]|uniref:helix-turn-helix domain-containing protein n=1 Tax=Marinobacter sp. TaxID=50741 RepID=UPI001B628CE0|nr:helix-turn-helix transcriptional regulator [Marinobacter sp.]MBQ0832285.1 helix-turn-helix transcriptional regulator [Marinobacter sp.]
MGSTICEAFGQNLRAIRKSKGLSRERLAYASGVDRSYVGKIERGEVNLTIEKLYKFVGCLESSPKDLLPDL